MNKKTMSKVALITAIVCIVMAVVVFIFADGLRRWYSGIFFAVMGLAMLVNTLRWRRVANEQQQSRGSLFCQAAGEPEDAAERH